MVNGFCQSTIVVDGFSISGQVGSGIGQNTGYRVGFGSGRSVKICDRVFPGISFSLGYFQVFRVFRVFSGIFGYFLGISGMLGDTRNFGFTRYIG